MPVYWRQKYAGRGKKHRAFIRQDVRREAAARAQAGPSLRLRLRAWLRRS